ncbi:hypothetical protein [Streptomyces flavofungini]|uniref:Uncharacterized protein n=1 Tax=Streptomyces flavofungini TaxID=68200 RepID=A0ABS0X9G4_9ACTN|nr:hypothetical protein [Streptomyces flavofungini]MBJ3809840.1 hypothetical protein [Streptomyces flavofungini]GHC81091.1 hypothetical protein GCM10010349_64010 [Streptomyces flavofungini]
MSGSPKYSSVRVGALYAQREAAERRRRAEERRARERRRATRRAQLAQEAARRRAEVALKDAELANRRAAERDARLVRARAEQSRADERGLGEVHELLAEAQRSGARADVGFLERELAELRARVARGEQVGDAVERLRGRVVSLRPAAAGSRGEDRAAVLAELERGFTATGPDGGTLDADGHKRCADLLDELRAAAGPDRQVRFDALLGTVEHALARHAATVTQARESAARQDQEETERQARAERERATAEAAERQRAEAAAAALELALAEATERLDAVRPAAQGVRDTAVELGDPGLADEFGDALRTADEALGARSAAEALQAVADLEGRLPDAEGRLDELELAYQRSRDLVAALRDAMTGEGFAFEGGEDEGGSFRLHFTRPTGATYETTVGIGDDGAPVLVYHVEGEPDVTLHAPRDEAVCDTTEALLERVHEALGGDDGFVPGELTWDGKPPGRRAKPLPRDTAWRWTTP